MIWGHVWVQLKSVLFLVSVIAIQIDDREVMESLLQIPSTLPQPQCVVLVVDPRVSCPTCLDTPITSEYRSCRHRISPLRRFAAWGVGQNMCSSTGRGNQERSPQDRGPKDQFSLHEFSLPKTSSLFRS